MSEKQSDYNFKYLNIKEEEEEEEDKKNTEEEEYKKHNANPNYIEDARRINYVYESNLNEIDVIKHTKNKMKENNDMNFIRLIIVFSMMMFIILFTIFIIIIAVYTSIPALIVLTSVLSALCMLIILFLIQTVVNKGFDNEETDKRIVLSIFVLMFIYFCVLAIVFQKSTMLSIWTIINNLDSNLQILTILITMTFIIISVLFLLYIKYSKKIRF